MFAQSGARYFTLLVLHGTAILQGLRIALYVPNAIKCSTRVLDYRVAIIMTSLFFFLAMARIRCRNVRLQILRPIDFEFHTYWSKLSLC